MLHANFPTDPHQIIDPIVRWHPGEELLHEMGYEKLLPPLVHKIRKSVKAWRDSGYEGASATTKALLRYWFETEHLVEQGGVTTEFRWYFAQREAVESAIWLYEVEQARDPYSLIRYDSSGQVSQAMFDEQWPRYVLKLATGVGKTKVISLLMTWCYFHKRYVAGSPMSSNFLLIAPNIIVLQRLQLDFQGGLIFFEDPLLPHNGYEGQNWRDDFQITVHLQDTIGPVSDSGNLFLSNIHRVYQGGAEPSFEDEDTADYFLGKKPTGATTDSGLGLDEIVRAAPDLIVFNDEAHHIHDKSLAWFKSIADIDGQLRLRGGSLAAQFDLTATPKHNNGAIFVQTVSDFPLVEAIRQGIVKTPVLPDEASRGKLHERISDVYVEKYEDYLHLGYLEWRKAYDDMARLGKKAVLFVMTDDTSNCDDVAKFLESKYGELRNKVLVIHTNKSGEIKESAASKRDKDELETLREHSREIDSLHSPYLAIVSVMMLREGWDVQNVTCIVGLRPYKAKSQILPEQTLGRGLRRMFRGQDVKERVSVIGTDGFISFVETIKQEGVELEYAAMGAGTNAKAPMVIEVDRQNEAKDIDKLDIELPVLAPRIYREYKNLDQLDPAKLTEKTATLKQFSADEQREIVFKNLDTDDVSHSTVIESTLPPNPQSVIGYFTNTLMTGLRLVGGFDVLFAKVKNFFENHLFGAKVDLTDPNVLRNLSELEARNIILESFKTAINALTVTDRGSTEVRNYIKYSDLRPRAVNPQDYVVPTKSIFNRITGHSKFELEFASFLDKCDIISFVKNEVALGLRVEYVDTYGNIAPYYPDFVVKERENAIWIIETKGAEFIDDPLKFARLKQWCSDATAQNPGVTYKALYVKEEDWKKQPAKSFAELVGTAI
jgi:type III restriction enzyme